MAEFDTPDLKVLAKIPVVVAGTMAHCRPFAAAPQHQASRGWPGELVDNWQQGASDSHAHVELLRSPSFS